MSEKNINAPQANTEWISKMFAQDIGEKSPDRVALETILKVIECLIVAQPNQGELLRGILGEIFRTQIKQQSQITDLQHQVGALEQKLIGGKK